MPAIWSALGLTKKAWDKASPAQKRKARALKKKGFKGLAKATIKRRASKSKSKKKSKISKAAKKLGKYTTLTAEGRREFFNTVGGMR